MEKFRRIIRIASELSIVKTIFFNFKYLPFRKAVRIPIIVSRHLRVRRAGGSVTLPEKVSSGMIRLGFDSCGIFDNKRSRSVWEVSGDVIFKGKAMIGNGCKICVIGNGKLIVGQRIRFRGESTVIASTHVEIGDDCGFSWDVLIMDTDFHDIYDSDGNCINSPSAVIISNNVWVGCRCLILKGSVIPSGCVVAAATRISKPFSSENCIIGKNPATEIKQDIRWVR